MFHSRFNTSEWSFLITFCMSIQLATMTLYQVIGSKWLFDLNYTIVNSLKIIYAFIIILGIQFNKKHWERLFCNMISCICNRSYTMIVNNDCSVLISSVGVKWWRALTTILNVFSCFNWKAWKLIFTLSKYFTIFL